MIKQKKKQYSFYILIDLFIILSVDHTMSIAGWLLAEMGF